MSLETEIRALRDATALSGGLGRSCFRLSGPGAFAAADSLCPRELFLRDGQMLHTLLLSEKAIPIADLYLCADGEDFLLLCEGAEGLDPAACIQDRLPAGVRVEVADLTADHDLLSLNGPYAWELLSEVISPEVIGLPYLGFYHGEGFTCFRAGSSGEFSYDLLVPRAEAPEWRARIAETGRGFDLAEAGREALDLCALENFFFNVRRDVTSGTTPLELQLQWRVSRKKSFVGSEALAERRRHWSQRAMLTAAAHPPAAGDPVYAGNRSVGRVLQAARSLDRGEWLALTLVDLDLAHAGVFLECASGGREFPMRVLSAPAINNRSLYVDPQRHSYSARMGARFPPLILALPA